MAINRVKISSDIELKDRLVAINRVTKVTKGGHSLSLPSLSWATVMVSLAGAWEKPVK